MNDNELQTRNATQILVVDDTPANLKLLTEILTNHGYRVRPASNGRLALKSVAAMAPDLILLDITMPDMDGYEVCCELKSNENSSSIPVIFISALNDTTYKVRGFESGGIDFITKPFQAAEVLARVDTHLSLRRLQKKIEEQNLQLHQEIAERVRFEEELKNTQAQMLHQEKMASIGQLAAGVAHEINNPLGFILSNLASLKRYTEHISEFEKLQSGLIREFAGGARKPAELVEMIAGERKRLKFDKILKDIPHLIAETIEGGEQVKRIVQDLKSFSRPDGMDWETSDINTMLDSTLNVIWNELKHKASVIREYGEIPLLTCNPGQLGQVFANILINAAQSIEMQGEIRICTGQEGGSVFITISDTGCGIHPDRLSRIFEPFFTTKEVGIGTGIGLSIAYDIIKKHNGGISVESRVGEGTTFTVRIPIVSHRNSGVEETLSKISICNAA